LLRLTPYDEKGLDEISEREKSERIQQRPLDANRSLGEGGWRRQALYALRFAPCGR